MATLGIKQIGELHKDILIIFVCNDHFFDVVMLYCFADQSSNFPSSCVLMFVLIKLLSLEIFPILLYLHSFHGKFSLLKLISIKISQNHQRVFTAGGLFSNQNLIQLSFVVRCYD